MNFSSVPKLFILAAGAAERRARPPAVEERSVRSFEFESCMHESQHRHHRLTVMYPRSPQPVNTRMSFN